MAPGTRPLRGAFDLAATLAGRVTLRTWAGHEPLAVCDAGDHRLVLTRQGR